MRDRLLIAATAIARVIMVVVAFGLAVGSIGLASVRGFCPETDAAAGLDVVAAAADPVATVVEQPPEGVDPESPAPDSEGDTPEEGGAPADEDPVEDSGGACPGGAQRCLPPLVSSVLILGEPACNEQAPARLRSILVPSLVGSTVLLAGAWWLRPSRLHALREEHTTS